MMEGGDGGFIWVLGLVNLFIKIPLQCAFVFDTVTCLMIRKSM